MRFPRRLFAAALLALPHIAIADEAELSDPIARAPSYALEDLVPTAIAEGVSSPFGMQAEVMSNAPERPFQVTFDITMPAFANVTMSLLVSEAEFATELVTTTLEMAEAGAAPGGVVDMDVLPHELCIGVVEQNQINCMIGSAAVQFSAIDFTGGDGIDYEATKALFQTLRLDVYREVFGS
jgi:hypothetical protein